VTLNDRLDYFGQTVNVAARVQSLADANEIYLTRDIYETPGVRDLLAVSFDLEPEVATLPGLHEEVPVFRVIPRHASAGAA
jgi:class 3 adenylate cyclase